MYYLILIKTHYSNDIVCLDRNHIHNDKIVICIHYFAGLRGYNKNAPAIEVRFYEYCRRHNGNHTVHLWWRWEEKQLSKTAHNQFTLYCGWSEKKK